jgi:hypothetical protein
MKRVLLAVVLAAGAVAPAAAPALAMPGVDLPRLTWPADKGEQGCSVAPGITCSTKG